MVVTPKPGILRRSSPLASSEGPDLSSLLIRRRVGLISFSWALMPRLSGETTDLSGAASSLFSSRALSWATCPHGEQRESKLSYPLLDGASRVPRMEIGVFGVEEGCDESGVGGVNFIAMELLLSVGIYLVRVGDEEASE